MKSITVHKIDGPLFELLRSKAKSEGLSINKTIKNILEESLGVRPVPSGAFRRDFEEFCGIWSDRELVEFEENTASLRKIDTEDWQ